MAKNNLNFDTVLGGNLNLFDENKKEENQVNKEEKKENIKQKENLAKTEKKSSLEKGKKKILNNDSNKKSLDLLIEQKNNLVSGKSVNQVHINNDSKEILNRLKLISGYSLSSIVDALIIDYYIENKEEITKSIKKINNISIF